MSEQDQHLLLSIVVPVYSGADFIAKLAERIDQERKSFESNKFPIRIGELIFVNDEARDESDQVLTELQRDYPWVSVLRLSRNYGQHAATVAGLLHTSGDWVVTMDEDLQHPPREIVSMLKQAARDGGDVVYATPISGVHSGFFRDVSSRLFKSFISVVTGNPLLSKVNSFRLIRGPIARAASAVCSHETYFDVALMWFTSRIGCLDMDLRDIRHHESKKSGYSIRSLMSHARRMLVSNEIKLLRLGVLIGATMVVASFILALFLSLRQIFFPEMVEIRGWASIMVSVLVTGGTAIFMLGVMLEYLSILVQRAHGKPVFFVVNRSSDKALVDFFGASE